MLPARVRYALDRALTAAAVAAIGAYVAFILFGLLFAVYCQPGF